MGKYRENLFKGAYALIFQHAKELRIDKSTKAEELLWEYLRSGQICGCKFRRQHPLSNFIVDFYCHKKKLIIEVDGGYHSKLEQAHMDEMRELCLKDYGIKVIRFKNEEILDNIENVLKVIESLLNSSGKNQ